MMMLSHDVRIWLCAGYTDMRKGFDGLAAMAQHELNVDNHNLMKLNEASHNLKSGWPRLEKRNNSVALLCNFSEALVFLS